jgi:hypothetical protein
MAATVPGESGGSPDVGEPDHRWRLPCSSGGRPWAADAQAAGRIGATRVSPDEPLALAACSSALGRRRSVGCGAWWAPRSWSRVWLRRFARDFDAAPMAAFSARTRARCARHLSVARRLVMAAAHAKNSPTFARPRTRTFMCATSVGFFKNAVGAFAAGAPDEGVVPVPRTPCEVHRAGGDVGGDGERCLWCTRPAAEPTAAGLPAFTGRRVALAPWMLPEGWPERGLLGAAVTPTVPWVKGSIQ